MSFHQNAELLVAGLLTGGIYAVGAFGLSIVYGTAKILNLAHGSFIMLGALITYFLFITTGQDPFIIGALIMPIFFIVGSFLAKSLAISGMMTPSQQTFHSIILVTLGIAISLEGISHMLIPREFSVSYYLPTVQIATISISGVRLTILGFVAILAITLEVFLKRTFIGKATRAVADDREAAQLMGIDVEKISMITFGIGTALAALSGLFMILITVVSSNVGLPLTLRAVTIVILGGLGSVPGTLAGAILLGLGETFSGFYLGSVWSATIAMIILITVLVSKPQGLFRTTR